MAGRREVSHELDGTLTAVRRFSADLRELLELDDPYPRGGPVDPRDLLEIFSTDDADAVRHAVDLFGEPSREWLPNTPALLVDLVLEGLAVWFHEHQEPFGRVDSTILGALQDPGYRDLSVSGWFRHLASIAAGIDAVTRRDRRLVVLRTATALAAVDWAFAVLAASPGHQPSDPLVLELTVDGWANRTAKLVLVALGLLGPAII